MECRREQKYASIATAALAFQTATGESGRGLLSLTNAHSLEHGVLSPTGTDLEAALAGIFSEVLAERPQWEWLSLAELDPRDSGYAVLVRCAAPGCSSNARSIPAHGTKKQPN